MLASVFWKSLRSVLRFGCGLLLDENLSVGKMQHKKSIIPNSRYEPTTPLYNRRDSDPTFEDRTLKGKRIPPESASSSCQECVDGKKADPFVEPQLIKKRTKPTILLSQSKKRLKGTSDKELLVLDLTAATPPISNVTVKKIAASSKRGGSKSKNCGQPRNRKKLKKAATFADNADKSEATSIDERAGSRYLKF
jgi:hypothetical protein